MSQSQDNFIIIVVNVKKYLNSWSNTTLHKIPDNYGKIVIAMECGLSLDRNGINIV